ncbi:peptidase M48 [Leptospira gomenensis]|uniref:Peptidase M48 n=1 Tax=Leptospira gomenensis TaxID=2484974 RepID=A0A5F1YAB6_9LEPT|nr:M48 family metallopeptidase [Leptospira gomenensis]TGK33421.1 peptidase M48 [Leptospira gomenensis]TGK40943.1 peptidase M48 [Leptospira gomenensis]TGK46387.1 peptidase M48 [Leptospira gomenensis]TGK67477.1 peptidase M48 [Leptospira gomenensis]
MKRTIFFTGIFSFGCVLMFLLYKEQIQTERASTLAPFYQILGKPIRTMNRALTKVLSVDSLDEKEYGDAIRERFSELKNEGNKDYDYLNKLIVNLTVYKQKPFEYSVFIMEEESPNAFALPGGVIFVTRGLLSTLKSENELIAVLAHEIGHIEKSHCMDGVRFELLSKKIGTETLGKLADFAFQLMTRHSYNKTQEDEADVYAFELVSNTLYDPLGVGLAFQRLEQYSPETGVKKAKLLSEYFQSHPHMDLRREKFSEKAKLWWEEHPEDRRYKGARNLKNRITFETKDYEEEWIQGKPL